MIIGQILSESPSNRKILEIYIWLVASILVGGRVFIHLITNNGFMSASELPFFYYDMLAATLTFMFPILFSQVFGKLPFEYIRYRNARGTITQRGILKHNLSVEEKDLINDNVIENDSAIVQMRKLAKSSKDISEGLYTRTGVYLFIGVIIAFSGLAFFYIETATQTNATAEIPDSLTAHNLVSLLPKFGILFFIELVAFFFLRQYKGAMDEFRYYEAIKRKREENLVLMQINCETASPMLLGDLLEKTYFYSDQKGLKAGETTEILESRKLESGELALIEKVLSTIASRK